MCTPMIHHIKRLLSVVAAIQMPFGSKYKEVI